MKSVLSYLSSIDLRYPPLPDLFLDNIPHICKRCLSLHKRIFFRCVFLAWAFAASEYLIIGMCTAFLLILIFHKYW